MTIASQGDYSPRDSGETRDNRGIGTFDTAPSSSYDTQETPDSVTIQGVCLGVLFHMSSFFCIFVVLGIDPRTLYMLGKRPIFELNPSDQGVGF